MFEAYRTSRADEVAMFGWDSAQQDAFLRMQFNTQKSAYSMQFPGAVTSVITYGGEAAGRLIVDRRDAEISLTDIIVLPAFRRRGIAATLIRSLQAEAREIGVPVELSVNKANTAALALYTKLGFALAGESDLDVKMRWVADR